MNKKISKKIKNFVIFGSGDNAKMIFWQIYKRKDINFVGFIDHKKKIGTTIIKYQRKSYKVISDEKKINKNYYGIIFKLDLKIRKKIFKNINSFYKNFKWLSIVSDTAIISKNSYIGNGTFLGPGSIVNPNTKIGANCFINTGSIIEHDNNIGDFVVTGPGIITCGNVKINESVFIGAGSTIKEKLIIETNVVIGASSYVNKNCKRNKLYIGVPAKPK